MNSHWFFNYPVWNLEVFGGGFWIALMATIHVYVAHFAVGGGLFLVLTEMKALRENDLCILDYTQKHTKFFLLLSAVFGSITGVGIWFVISVLAPWASSILIHNFVFAWAAEWAFFLGEIVTLFIYFYTFGKMDKKNHLQVGWLYFIFGWLSLFVINGIVSFMLTPGDWLQTKDFWDGFFNPSFWPSLFFRTAICFMLAGLFGFITSLGLKDKNCQDKMIQYCSKWLIIPLFFVIITGWWYLAGLPLAQKNMILQKSPETIFFLKIFIGISPLIFIIGIIMAHKVSLNTKKILAGFLLLIGLAYMGSFEWIREAGRRPYIIYGHLYSNFALASDINDIKSKGVLKSSRWAKNTEINESNKIQAGQEIFKLLCSSCHSIKGPLNDIMPLTKSFTTLGMESMLSGMGKINTYMPQFMGNKKEAKALAAYIVNGLHKKQESTPETISHEPLTVDIPEFDQDKNEYILLARTDKGMRCISDQDKYFSFAGPGSNIYAQLIKRGESPEQITQDVVITYQIEDGFSNPSTHVDFWKYSLSLTGKKLPQNTGRTGNTTAGIMKFDENAGLYVADFVPVVPYKDDNTFNPYPLMTLEAKDNDGNVLVTTKIAIPVSTEMGCKSCHGGQWRKNETGISIQAARDILIIHDRMNQTDLLKQAEKGKPVSCQQCHFTDNKENLNLSAAIHGFHANYLSDRWADACAMCHPGMPSGVTKAFRGIHKEIGLDCINCHGTMEDHSLSLLMAEHNKKSAGLLMKNLQARVVDKPEDIKPRLPWINEPDCLNCHIDFQAPEKMETFNEWTQSEEKLFRMKTDEIGIMCAGCHGITHAIYPAGNEQDNIQPMQYQNTPYPIGANKNCRVCHMVDMSEEMHHQNSLTIFRNTR